MHLSISMPVAFVEMELTSNRFAWTSFANRSEVEWLLGAAFLLCRRIARATQRSQPAC